jgi:hypothetical protein
MATKAAEEGKMTFIIEGGLEVTKKGTCLELLQATLA